jgi:hypothetical protein
MADDTNALVRPWSTDVYKAPRAQQSQHKELELIHEYTEKFDCGGRSFRLV